MTWLMDFFPVADAPAITYEVSGPVLTVNGEVYDFTGILANEGDSYPASAIPGSEAWLRSTEVTLWEGKLRACVVMPFDSAARLPAHVRHPDPVEVESGRVPLPTDEVTNATA